MEILQLKYFFESAKAESFTYTAKKYQVPTTAVSSSIRRLEDELGCKLFERTANRIFLNEKGKRLEQALCTVFDELDQAIEDISTDYNDRREIKLLVRGMRRKITNLLSEFSRKHPNIMFKIVFSEADSDDYDIIIDDEKDIYRGYKKFELYSMRLHLKCASDNPISKMKLSLVQLCDQPFVSMEANSNMHRILTKACNKVGFHPKISAFCNDIECYEKLIASGMGIGIGREDYASETNNSNISDLDVTDFNESYTVYVYYKEKENYGNVKNLIDFLKKESDK
ncbi:MAG: LysR family transcriptional regulator [Ruminococcaceae bacterium]|nr:LysR family transcriptional regulator [Oscillospiraceae bacterium]